MTAVLVLIGVGILGTLFAHLLITSSTRVATKRQELAKPATHLQAELDKTLEAARTVLAADLDSTEIFLRKYDEDRRLRHDLEKFNVAVQIGLLQDQLRLSAARAEAPPCFDGLHEECGAVAEARA